MAKFKELQVGQQVRLVSSKHTDSEHGYIANPMLTVGAVGTIIGLRTTDKAIRLDGNPYVYHRKDLEIVSEDVSEPIRTEPVIPKELTLEDFVFTRVRVKEGGAKGTVIGHTPAGGVGVQHDVGSTQGWKHECSAILGDAQGAEARCYWYGVEELEIINEEV